MSLCKIFYLLFLRVWLSILSYIVTELTFLVAPFGSPELWTPNLHGVSPMLTECSYGFQIYKIWP